MQPIRAHKTAIIVSQLTPYVWQCAVRLASNPGRHVRVLSVEPSEHLGFGPEQFTSGYLKPEWAPLSQFVKQTRALVKTWQPDNALVGGWYLAGLRAAMRQAKRQSIPCLCLSDTPYAPTLRRRLCREWAKRHFLTRHCAAMMVPGERAAVQAERLGFSRSRQLRPLYCVDTSLYCGESTEPRNRHFLFAGRWAPEKNVARLIQAYRCYRKQVSDPWELHLAGPGQRPDASANAVGVRYLGMLQPPEFRKALARAGAFVLPSTFEPWGVVLLEAAAAGLPLLASWSCGSAVELIASGVNGFRFDPEDVGDMAATMKRLVSDESKLAAMGAVSRQLAGSYDCDVWVDNVTAWEASTRR